MQKPQRKPVVVGKLSDAKENGVAGIVGCAGCASARGTLEGKTFRCQTPTCRFKQVPVAFNPWVKGAKQ